MQNISIRGARTHNLKNVDLTLPRDQLIVVTGLSGSGKSSLAFDTIYAEGQRRYVESLSAYARQFLSVMDKPDVDTIDGLSPAIAIEQKSTSHNPRSTVGTVTEIHDYLRLLFARIGVPHCPEHTTPLRAQTVSQIVDAIIALDPTQRWMLLAPVSQHTRRSARWIDGLSLQGYLRIRVDGEVFEIADAPDLSERPQAQVEVVIDRFRIKPDSAQRLAESVEAALALSEGWVQIASMEGDYSQHFSANFSCPQCGFNAPKLEPRMFSFNSPQGACESCNGIGKVQFIDPQRVIVGEDLTLAEGAIRGWDRRNGYYFQIVQALATHYGIDLEVPWKMLPEFFQDKLLNGTGDEEVKHRFVSDRGSIRTSEKPFEGVIPNLQRRFEETQSAAIREELTKLMVERPCPECEGTRLSKVSRHVRIDHCNLPALCAMAISDCRDALLGLTLNASEQAIADKVLTELQQRLSFLINVGLDYLSLGRSADTLSGGEAQRIRLASQIGSGLSGVMYVLDEPSIGLHQRDNGRLLETLKRLRDLGNTVIVVEHDEEAIREADFVVDMGPQAGIHGGHVVVAGKIQDVIDCPESLTGQYLSGTRKISPTHAERKASGHITIRGARGNNLQNVDVEIPLGLMTCVTGVSGSGKSTLINATLARAAGRKLYRSSAEPAPHDAIEGLEQIEALIRIDQSPIGRTPRSNPATYTGLFSPIRDLFAATKESRSRGYAPGRFSFNVKGGRCEACQGDGLIRVEMHFLPDVYVPCEVCEGRRYNRETLDIRYRGLNIDEVLTMTIEDACEFFSAVPLVHKKLQTLADVGLGYIRLGQSATTLSGGEAQRIKLAKELSKRDTGKTLYILDEPTTGLHFADIELLLQILQRLTDHGNTLLVIEHNIDVIRCADHLIDMGPDGGIRGGTVVATGTPAELAQNPHSITGRYL